MREEFGQTLANLNNLGQSEYCHCDGNRPRVTLAERIAREWM